MLVFIRQLAVGSGLLFAAIAICSWLHIGALELWTSVYSVLAICVALSPFCVWLDYTRHGKLVISTTLILWLTLFLNLLLWRIVFMFDWLNRPVPNFQADKTLPFLVLFPSFVCAIWISECCSRKFGLLERTEEPEKGGRRA
jgi:hypothetical protein